MKGITATTPVVAIVPTEQTMKFVSINKSKESPTPLLMVLPIHQALNPSEARLPGVAALANQS